MAMKQEFRRRVSKRVEGIDRTPAGRPTQRARKLRAFRVYLDLVETAEAVQRVLAGQMATFGLTLEEFRFLEMLYRKGAMSTSAVRKERVCTRQNVSRAADTLGERGLVERKLMELPLSERDSRPKAKRQLTRRAQCVSEVRLTSAGEDFVGRVLPRHMKMVLAVLRTLDWKEQEALGRICAKLRDWNAFKLLEELEWEDAE